MTPLSLWLLPARRHSPQLAESIKRLSSQLAGTPFEPHVTIQGDIDMSQQDLTEFAASLARSGSEVAWPVSRVEAGTHFFQCVYLRFADNPAFAAMRAAALAATGDARGVAPFPHLSLVYAQPDPDHAHLCDALAEQFLGQTIAFDRIAVVRSSQAMPIVEWSVLAGFALLRTPAPSPTRCAL